MGARIKKARLAKSLTQVGLAERAGINNTVLCRYERGDRRPSDDHPKTLAKLLRVTVKSLVSGK